MFTFVAMPSSAGRDTGRGLGAWHLFPTSGECLPFPAQASALIARGHT